MSNCGDRLVLSQVGLLAIPQSPHQRAFAFKRTVLGDFNERRADGTWLHATKGWRRVSAKRTKVSLITEALKRGQRGWTSAAIKAELAGT